MPNQKAVTFFHTADIHFGVENYGKIDPKTGIHSRLLDFHKSLSSIVDRAIEQQIDFFLFCGDAYKTAYPTPTQQKLLVKLLLKLQAASIPVVIVVGNHDHPLSFGKAHSLDVFDYLPVEGFYVFSKPELMTIKTKSGLVQIVGIPWPARNNVVTHDEHRMKSATEITCYLSQRVGQLINQLAEQIDETIPAVLAGHLTVSSGVFSGSEKCAIFGNDPIFLPSQLALPQFDYVALGHLHRYQNLNPNGIPVVYAGSIERVDFGERKEEKSFCAVTITTIDGKKQCSYDVVPLVTRRMIQIDVMLESGLDQTRQIIQKLATYDLNEAIVKIMYHIPEGQPDKVDLFEVQRACQHAKYVVGVIPVHKLAKRERRAQVNVDMDFMVVLEKYIQTKDFLASKKDPLMAKAQQLRAQLDAQEQELEK
ncbi:exonuclease SbcCD subunit D [Candidatus Dependentiae bacterium]|jgi:exonuclease SbcD|nr:exonuclease SbcCD subunit D [Candidatus Dependentiae bacterium]